MIGSFVRLLFTRCEGFAALTRSSNNPRSLYFDSPSRVRQNTAELVKIYSDIVHQNIQ